MSERLASMSELNPRTQAAYNMSETIFRHNKVFAEGGTLMDEKDFPLDVKPLSDGEVDAHIQNCFGLYEEFPDVKHAVEAARKMVRQGE